jgi:hypothetical protein
MAKKKIEVENEVETVGGADNVIPAEEYDRRIKLSVSDVDYINPSLDHCKRG